MQATSRYFSGAVWVGVEGLLLRIDPRTDEITRYPVVDRPLELAPGDGELLVSTGPSPPKLPALAEDKVARFSLAENWLDDTDPAHAYPAPPFRGQFEHATNAQLLTYAAAPRATLEPEVAASMPVVSDGGRLYTFRVRPGFRFSPPSNEAVTAETFRYSIERALSPGLGPEAPGYSVVSDIVGAGTFHAGKARHISGIAVRGNELTIRLVAPSGDFPARLSMPFFAAVPIGTPVLRGGVQTPIPSAGPYYLKLAWEGELLVLERNPNYRGSRPHRLKRIEYALNDGPSRTVDRIESGDADYAADVLGESTFAVGSPLDARFGGTHKAGAPLLVRTPQLGLRFLRFNTARGAFTDARLRRAVNYAIDRRALAAVLGDTPSDSYLPPALRSSDRSSVYPFSPNPTRARALLRGFHGTVVLYTCADPDCSATARIVHANLAALGIPVKIEQFDDPFGEALKPGAAYDILLTTWFLDWADPSNFLNLFLDPNGFRPDWAPPPAPIPAAYRRELEHASLLRGNARATAYRRLAVKLERDVAPFAVYSTPVLPELFSGRVNCRVEDPVIGATDIGALCVKKR